MKICLDCGTPSTGVKKWGGGTLLCVSCRSVREAKRNAARGNLYGQAWQKLSRQARALQGWCTRCGSTVDLTLDHETMTVECRSCNSSHRGTTVPSK